jgi:hypothetical protein
MPLSAFLRPLVVAASLLVAGSCSSPTDGEAFRKGQLIVEARGPGEAPVVDAQLRVWTADRQLLKASGHTGADGRVELEDQDGGVARGSYVLEVSPPAHYVIAPDQERYITVEVTGGGTVHLTVRLAIDVTGEWAAEADASRESFFAEADTFRFVLVQCGASITGSSPVEGTWGATGSGGVVVKPNQQVGGETKGDDVSLGIRYSRYDHGCVGPSSACYDLLYRVVGTVSAVDRMDVRVMPPPHPTIPDSEMVLAEWTLRRQ